MSPDRTGTDPTGTDAGTGTAAGAVRDRPTARDLAYRPGVATWITRHADRLPTKPALVLDGVTLTYRDLETRTWQVARTLRALGVRVGDRVGLLHDNHAEFLPVTLAILRLGAIYVPLNARLADDEIAALVADSRPSVLVTQEARLPRATALADGRADLVVRTTDGPDWPGVDAPADPFDVGAFDEDSPAGLFYTSGTTGLPKGAIITHRNIASVATSLAVDLGFDRDDRPLVSLPISVSGAMLAGVLPFLHLGCSIRLLEVATPELIAAAIRDYRPSYMASVPTVFKALLDHPSFDDLDLSCFQRVLSAAASMPVSLIERFRERGLEVFVQGYGLTESCGFSTCLMPEDALRKVGSIGRPLMYSDVRVLVGDREAEPGEIGELCVSGPSIMAGYWERPDERPIVDGWLRTGDLGHADAEGYLYVTGRLKDMVITGGYNVYPAEVENVVYQLPGVAEAAVIGVPDERWGERVVAVVRARPDAAPDAVTAATVGALCARHLADYKRPKEVLVVTTPLPVNPTGKIVKARLRTAYAEGSLA
ncbi:class I adenylate-forming enzyme family protein [Nocardioides alkalitolerans]|uniref:class I adenylate-forming enzyme family protein n=1 Tax=Nocardioides alkalitolerans TaxID=281714 RepID=UPI0003F732EF|nr:AMP-binding protein [Nocardioides alkalitolerans]